MTQHGVTEFKFEQRNMRWIEGWGEDEGKDRRSADRCVTFSRSCRAAGVKGGG